MSKQASLAQARWLACIWGQGGSTEIRGPRPNATVASSIKRGWLVSIDQFGETGWYLHEITDAGKEALADFLVCDLRNRKSAADRLAQQAAEARP